MHKNEFRLFKMVFFCLLSLMKMNVSIKTVRVKQSQEVYGTNYNHYNIVALFSSCMFRQRSDKQHFR